MVSDLRRGLKLGGQEGTNDQHRSVSVTSYLPTTERLPSPRLQPGQQFRTPQFQRLTLA